MTISVESCRFRPTPLFSSATRNGLRLGGAQPPPRVAEMRRSDYALVLFRPALEPR